MLRSRAERPGWESLCASRCTPPAHVEPAPGLARASSPSASSERPRAPRRAGDPLHGCATRQAAGLVGRLSLCPGLRTDEISGIFRSAGAGWGDAHPPSWFRFLCLCLEEPTRLRDSLRRRTAWPGCCSRGLPQNGRDGCQHGGGFDFTSTPDPGVVIFPAARQSRSPQPCGKPRSLKKPPRLLSPHLTWASSATQPDGPEGK